MILPHILKHILTSSYHWSYRPSWDVWKNSISDSELQIQFSINCLSHLWTSQKPFCFHRLSRRLLRNREVKMWFVFFDPLLYNIVLDIVYQLIRVAIYQIILTFQSYYVWCRSASSSWLAPRGRECSFHHLLLDYFWSHACRTLPYINRQYSERPWRCFWKTFNCYLLFLGQLHNLTISLTLTQDAVIHEFNICFLKLMLSLCPFLCVKIDIWFEP